MSGSEEEEFLPEDVADDDDVVIAQEEISQSLKKMNKIVNNLMARADCVPFREPVDWKGLELYDYPKIVAKMMDLGTIKKKLEKGKYNSASDAASDVRLVWKNCMTYNADGSDFYKLADSYNKRFEERYQKLIDEFGEDVICGSSSSSNIQQRSSSRASSSGKKSRSNSFTSSGRKTPNDTTTAEDNYSPDKSVVNYEALGIIPLDVRTRFAARLQRLSGMELGHVLQTIDMSCPEALEDPTHDELRLDAPNMVKRHRYGWDDFDGGCQIEIDVDAIPAETFYKLDAYVKEKVQDRGRGPWSDDLTEAAEASGIGGGGGGGRDKKRKIKSM